MTPFRFILPGALLAAALGGTAPLDAQQIDTLAIRAHTRFLADDMLLGRGTGTQGERLAAAYIESRLIELGVQPLGDGGRYTLPVPLAAATVLPGTQVVIERNGERTTFRSGRDFIVNTGGANAFRNFDGRVIFAGPPSAAAPLIRDMPDVRGRVIAMTGPLGGDAVTLVPLLIERGAAGVIILISDPAQFDLYVRSRGDRRYFAKASVGDPVWQPDLPVLLAGPSLVAALMSNAPAGVSSGPLRAAVDLGRTITATIRTSVQDVPSANVGGIIRGTDPELRDQVVVYTAHYDHLGVSVPDARGDSIYNGFSDNAAGTAMLLAIAAAFERQPPARSVAFLFFSGEERGLLGSSYLAAAPPFPLNTIRAVINLDAGAPPAPPVSWRIAGGVESAALGALAGRVAARAGWRAESSTASPNSDYWPFLSRGVPSVFIVPGSEWENVSSAQQTALRERWDHYHQAADEWHADFPFAGLERYAAFALMLGREAAAR